MMRRFAWLLTGWVLLLAVRVEGRQPADCCCPPGCGAAPACERGWTSGGYLLMWIDGQPLPPLVTTGPISVVGPDNRPATLGLPGTQVLIGGEDLDSGPFSGGQLTLGRWLGDGGLGVEVGGFFLARRSAGHALAADGSVGSTALSIPFFNAALGQESSTGIALPAPQPMGEFPFAGAVSLQVSSELWGAEVNLVRPLAARPDRRLELLAGFRFLSVDEELRFDTASTSVTPPFDIFQTADRFHCDNDFYGGQIGIRGQFDGGLCFLQGSARIAFGLSHQVTTISGSLLTNDFNPQFGVGPPALFPGGYLALPTNIGRHEADHFAVVPELGIRGGCRLTERLTGSVGYSVLFISSLARPGDQIDRVINPTQGPAFTGDPNQALAGPARPVFLDNDSDLWVHGLSFTLELRY